MSLSLISPLPLAMKLPGSFAHVLCHQPLSSQLLACHPYVAIFRNESLMYVFPLLDPPGHILPSFYGDPKFLFTEDETWETCEWF